MTFKKLETGQEKRCKSDRVLLMSSLCHAQAILPFPPDKITLLLLCRSDHPIYLTHSPEYYNSDDDDCNGNDNDDGVNEYHVYDQDYEDDYD